MTILGGTSSAVTENMQVSSARLSMTDRETKMANTIKPYATFLNRFMIFSNQPFSEY
jgi:hypothetical protein